MIWLAIACSGPGAMAVIESNERWAWKLFIAAAVVAALAIAYCIVRRRASRWIAVPLVALAIHPALWMGARGGDCGHMLYFASVAASIVVVVFSLFAASGITTRRAPTP